MRIQLPGQGYIRGLIHLKANGIRGGWSLELVAPQPWPGSLFYGTYNWSSCQSKNGSNMTDNIYSILKTLSASQNIHFNHLP